MNFIVRGGSKLNGAYLDLEEEAEGGGVAAALGREAPVAFGHGPLLQQVIQLLLPRTSVNSRAANERQLTPGAHTRKWTRERPLSFIARHATQLATKRFRELTRSG